jgi:hypothetical protein
LHEDFPTGKDVALEEEMMKSLEEYILLGPLSDDNDDATDNTQTTKENKKTTAEEAAKENEKHEGTSAVEKNNVPTSPTPAKKTYYYIDCMGNERGPHPLEQMISWIMFFEELTMIKEKKDDALQPLMCFPELAAEMKRHREMQARSLPFLLGHGASLNQPPKEEKPSASGGGSQHPKQTITGEAAFTGKCTNKKPQVECLKNSPSESMVQVKDAVVRQQFDSMSKKLVFVLQKMTSYKTNKQNDNNALFRWNQCPSR